MMPAPPALMRVFQTMAQNLGDRFGLPDVFALQAVGVAGPVFYCHFRLPPGQLPATEGWDESCEAESIEDALDNLHLALRLRAEADLFCLN